MSFLRSQQDTYSQCIFYLLDIAARNMDVLPFPVPYVDSGPAIIRFPEPSFYIPASVGGDHPAEPPTDAPNTSDGFPPVSSQPEAGSGPGLSPSRPPHGLHQDPGDVVREPEKPPKPRKGPIPDPDPAPPEAGETAVYWKHYNELAEQHDEDMLDALGDDLDNLLVFVGAPFALVGLRC